MGQVIDFEVWRRDHRLSIREDGERPDEGAMGRLERAIRRLEVLVRRGTGRIGPRVETELLAITGAVTAGSTEEAAERAERLAERLEHPSARAL